MASSTATDNEHFVDEIVKEISDEDQVACGGVTDDARLRAGVFILMAGADCASMQPIGTAFVISPRHVLTAAHNVRSTDAALLLVRHIQFKHYYGAMRVKRTLMESEQNDWLILTLEEEEKDFGSVLNIAGINGLPIAEGREAAVYAISAPMAMFKEKLSATIDIEIGRFNRIRRYDFNFVPESDVDGKRGFSPGPEPLLLPRENPHAIFICVERPLDPYSGGAPYINQDGAVVAMHIANTNAFASPHNVLTNIKKRRGLAEDFHMQHDEEIREETSALLRLGPKSRCDLKLGLVLCKDMELMGYLTQLLTTK